MTINALGAGLVQSSAGGLLSSGAVDRNSATYFNTALTVPNGGTGITTTTAYGLLTGGTTATGAFQNAGTGSAGQILQSAGASALPTWVSNTAANTCSDCLVKVPALGKNVVSPTANSSIGLTINGTSGTAAAALNIVQAGTAGNVIMSNSAATASNLISLTHTTSAYTGNAIFLNLANSSGSFNSGNFIELQKNAVSQYRISSVGAVTQLGDLTINTNKFQVTASSGDTAIAGRVSLSGATGNQLNITGTPAANSTSSLVQYGAALANGSASGTYLGINSPNGSTYDFLRFEKNGVSQLRVDNAGLLNATGGYAMGVNIGVTANCSGGQVLSGADYNGGIVTNGTCSSPSGFVTLQNAYDNSGSSSPQITLNSTGKGVWIDDNSTPVGGNLFQVGNDGHSTIFLGVSSTLVTTSGNLQVAGNSTLSGFLRVGSSVQFQVDASGNTQTTGTLKVGTVGSQQFQVSAAGNTTITGASLTVGTGGGTPSQFEVSAGGAVTETYRTSTNNATAATFNVTNIAAGAGTTTVNALGINLAGTATAGGTNTNIGVNFGNIAGLPLSGNTFNALVIGTGYTNILNLGGTPLITGAGKIQDAAIDSTVTYSNLQKVGALNTGSIVSGFGTISTTNNITTTAALQGNTLAIGNASSFNRFTVDTNGNVAASGGYVQSGSSANTLTGATTISNVLTLSGATAGNQLKVSGAFSAAAGVSLVQLSAADLNSGTSSASGTYLGINQPAAGAGSAADFVNFQNNGTTRLQVTTAGNIVASGSVQASSLLWAALSMLVLPT